MTIENWDEIGWPAEGTRVVFDPATLHGPFFPATERRLECREANAKWLLVPGNREKARKAKAAYKRRTRSTRTASATTATHRGAKL